MSAIIKLPYCPIGQSNYSVITDGRSLFVDYPLTIGLSAIGGVPQSTMARIIERLGNRPHDDQHQMIFSVDRWRSGLRAMEAFATQKTFDIYYWNHWSIVGHRFHDDIRGSIIINMACHNRVSLLPITKTIIICPAAAGDINMINAQLGPESRYQARARAIVQQSSQLPNVIVAIITNYFLDRGIDAWIGQEAHARADSNDPDEI